MRIQCSAAVGAAPVSPVPWRSGLHRHSVCRGLNKGVNNPSHDPDPTYNPDCVQGNPTQAGRIRVAEIQAFSSSGSATGSTGDGGTGGTGGGGGTTGCQDDDIVLTGAATAAPGSTVQYTITYNISTTADSGCELQDHLPDDLTSVRCQRVSGLQPRAIDGILPRNLGDDIRMHEVGAARKS